MPLTQQDISAFELLANDPEDRAVLLERLERHKNVPAVANHPAFKAKQEVDTYQKPLLDKIKSLEEKLSGMESSTKYDKERAELRKAPYNFDDKKIAQFEERYSKEIQETGIVFPGYRQAADYFRRMDSPVAASTAPLMGSFIPPSTGQQWREDMNSADPKVNPLKMDRRTRKLYVRKLAQEAGDEFKTNLGIM